MLWITDRGATPGGLLSSHRAVGAPPYAGPAGRQGKHEMTAFLSSVDGAIERGAQVVGIARADLRADLAGLRDQLSGIGAHWSGEGATAFLTVMDRWDVAAGRLVDALLGFEDALRASAATYATTDEAQHRSFAALAARLG